MSTLELTNVRCAWSESWWDGRSNNVYETLNVTLEPGEWCGIVGDNGLGKSTLLHGIAGCCPHVQGEIKVHDKHYLRPCDLCQRFDLGIYLVPQEPKCPARWTFADIEAMAFHARPGIRVELFLQSLRKRLQDCKVLDPNEVRFFSAQEARTLLGILTTPSVLLLDEAGRHFNRVTDSGADSDPLPAEEFYAMVKDILPLATVLYVEHEPGIARNCADKLIKASLRSSGSKNAYAFEVIDPVTWSGGTQESCLKADDTSPPLPLLDFERPVNEHVQLALRASSLTAKARRVTLHKATQQWSFLDSAEQADKVSGGQKVILHCIMEILAYGKADLAHSRTAHVFPDNVESLRDLQQSLPPASPPAARPAGPIRGQRLKYLLNRSKQELARLFAFIKDFLPRF